MKINTIKILLALLILNFLHTSVANAQVGINNDDSSPDASAMLDIKSTDKGILIPRMTTTERDNISSAAVGLLIYNTSTNNFNYFNGTLWDIVGDTLGNHIASQNIQLNDNFLSNDGTDKGITLANNGSLVMYGTAARTFLSQTTSGANYFEFRNDIGTRGIFGVDGNGFTGGSPLDVVLANYSNGGLKFYTNATLRASISNSGLFQIDGGFKLVNGTQGAGKVLVSDADGNATWQDVGISVPDTTQPIPLQYHGGYIFVHPTDNASDVDWTTAQSTCAALSAFGYDDWYLPARLELDAMYKQSYLITGLSQTTVVKYWSNSEYDANNAYAQRLDYGGPDPDAKSDTSGHNCRCVRSDE